MTSRSAVAVCGHCGGFHPTTACMVTELVEGKRVYRKKVVEGNRIVQISSAARVRVVAMREKTEDGHLLSLQVQHRTENGEWEEAVTATTEMHGNFTDEEWRKLGGHESSEIMVIAERSE